MTRAFILSLVMVATPLVAAQPKREASEKAADDRDKQICKRFVDTGSLVRSHKVCKTKWEWEQERQNVQAQSTASGSLSCSLGNGC